MHTAEKALTPNKCGTDSRRKGQDVDGLVDSSFPQRGPARPLLHLGAEAEAACARSGPSLTEAGRTEGMEGTPEPYPEGSGFYSLVCLFSQDLKWLFSQFHPTADMNEDQWRLLDDAPRRCGTKTLPWAIENC